MIACLGTVGLTGVVVASLLLGILIGDAIPRK